jgi:FAD/FMN-containing dehydrogenase/Fe-S oxidoreductase
MPAPAALPDFLAALRQRASGDLRSDDFSRAFYATDASIYQKTPYGVLIPRHADDIQAALETAAQFRLPLLPRGAGSSLAGQAVNEALVVDVSRHLDQIIEVNREARWVRVQPGVVLDDLNARLAPLGLQFGPDPASSNRATLGGIVSNNSTGAHSILYGMTADHVLAVDALLADGTPVHCENLNADQFIQKRMTAGSEGDVYRGVARLLEGGADAIRRGTPRHWRRCGGYNLDRFVEVQGGAPSFKLARPPGFNLAQLICGAEGTLAFITEIKLNLVPLPSHTALAIVHFPSLHAALSAVPRMLETRPSAIELLDHLGLTRSRQVPEYARLLDTFITGNPNCVLITEYTGGSAAEIRAGVDALKRSRVGQAVVELYTPAQQAKVWQVRKVALGFLMSVKGDYKPVPFIEDAAVPVDTLAEYVRRIEEFCNGLGTQVGYYAHASAGCLHIRPIINTKAATEIAKMPEILNFSVELLGEYGGALSSEHGDGRARSWINEKFFGAELYALYRQTKRAFDPHNLLNPGNVVDSPAMTENLRYGAHYQTIPLHEHLDFTQDGGFARAVEMCNGAGICRKSGGTMCPSFMATREEEHSTRGRANALRAALSGALPPAALTSPRMYQTFDLCIECKACKAECPSGVDMAKIKFEFLAHYYEKHRIPLRARLFAALPRLSRLAASPLAPLANALLAARPVKWGMQQFLGISAARELPAFARRPFTATQQRNTPVPRPPSSVVLFTDTLNNFNSPETLHAAAELLAAAGYTAIPSRHGCCGRPAISKGLVDEARRRARETLDTLHPLARQGLPILALEPSCLSALKDDYASLLPADERVPQIAAAAMLVEEFLAKRLSRGELTLQFKPASGDILLHAHCHQKALFGTAAAREMLALTGARVTEVDSGCCGMAGSFGYEAEHYELSQKMGERRLFPAARAHSGIIAAPGASCRAQIAHGAGVRPRHPVEILRDAL